MHKHTQAAQRGIRRKAIMFEFQWPWLFILLFLPLLPLLLPLSFKRKVTPVERTLTNNTQASLKVPFLEEFIDPKQRQQKPSTSLWRKILLLSAWCLFISALAKPVWIDGVANLPISSRNIIVAVDLSGSMSQRDFLLSGSKISRLAAIKKVASEFISKRAGDRIGLILFADHAYLQAPLTRDLTTVMTLLDEAEQGLAGDRTALGNAIALAVKKVQEKPKQEHVLVLMTDGAATVGMDVNEAIEFAKKVKLKIYTIGIGSNTTTKSALAGRNKVISTSPDDATLKQIAQQTEGFYFKANNMQQLQSIYEKIDELEPVIDLSQAWHPTKDIFYLPLSLALALVSLLFLRNLLHLYSIRFKEGQNHV